MEAHEEAEKRELLSKQRQELESEARLMLQKKEDELKQQAADLKQATPEHHLFFLLLSLLVDLT